MVFNTRYERKRDKAEANNGKLITEQIGYVPAKLQIDRMLRAGNVLSAYRKGLYDYDPEIDNDEPDFDLTRDGDFDLVDLDQVMERLEQKEQAKEAESRRVSKKPGGEQQKKPGEDDPADPTPDQV